MPTWEERQDHEAEIRRRWDRATVLSECGAVGRAMVAVVDAVPTLDEEGCRRLEEAYVATHEEAEAAGATGELERAFSYGYPYPEYPGDLFAIDPWSRMAFNYAGLIARERAVAVGRLPGMVPVERTAMGMVLALSVDRAREGGWFHPVSEELALWLARPWISVVGDPRSES